jgi:hypothetical protein
MILFLSYYSPMTSNWADSSSDWSTSTSLNDIQQQQIEEEYLAEAQDIYEECIAPNEIITVNTKIKFTAYNKSGNIYGFADEPISVPDIIDDMGNQVQLSLYIGPALINANPWIKPGRRCTLTFAHGYDKPASAISHNKVVKKRPVQETTYKPTATTVSNAFTGLDIE